MPDSEMMNAKSTDGGPCAPVVPDADRFFRDSAFEIVTTRLDVEPEAVHAAAALLSNAERKRASRFTFARERRRFIVARSRLRQLLGVRLGVSPDSVELVSGQYGKPALAGRFSDQDLRFNVSHCEDIAVYAFSRARDIGIDVEAVRVMHDAEDIAARFFSRRERVSYRVLKPRYRPLGFFNCWTRKEAFIKAVGEGLNYPLEMFDVSLAPGEPARILRIGNTFGDACGWRLHSFSPAPGFIGAVAVQRSAAKWSPVTGRKTSFAFSQLHH